MFAGPLVIDRQLPLALLGYICLLALVRIQGHAAENLAQKPELRRPVAAAMLADGNTLAVANARSGSVSLVDLAGGRIVGEYAVGTKLADLAIAADGKHALAAVSSPNALVALELSRTEVRVLGRLALDVQPAGVALAPSGSWASVASTWSHRLQFVRVEWPADGQAEASLRLEQSVELPFAPRLQQLLPGERLVVADAFGGHVALVDIPRARLLAQHELVAHNIRGLALSADGSELVLAHQVLDEHAPTSLENIERGGLMKNVLRRIRLTELVREQPPLEERSRVKEFGMPERGAADPAGIVPGEIDSVAVAFSGVDEVELTRLDDRAPDSAVRLTVGRRPTALVRYGAAGLAVLNTFDDSVSLIDLTERRVVRTVSLGPAAALAPQDRGELLFFDGRLSRDGWLSCHSCHSEGHTSGRLADTLGDDTFGTPKRTPTLLGTGLTYRWAWNGSQQNLHDQVQKSIEQTMHAGAYDPAAVGDLTAYLVFTGPPPPLAPATGAQADRDQIARGERVFHAHECAECHIPPLVYTSHEAYDVGLTDEKGLKKFNPPSLRGVGQGYRFLHDNRAASLPEVFRVVGHPQGQTITGAELDDLVRFLKTL